MTKTKKLRVKAWADVGSHGGIFFFLTGPVANLYPTLMHIHKEKVADYLIPVTIEYSIPARRRK